MLRLSLKYPHATPSPLLWRGVGGEAVVLTVLFFLFSFFSPLFSQTNKTESLKHQFSMDSARIYRIKPVRPIVGLDQRNSFLGRTKVNISGLQLGVTLLEKHTMGIGFYSILSNRKNTKLIGDKKETLNQNLELRYITHFYYYPIIDKKHFELGFPIEAGIGNFTVNVTDSIGRSMPGFPRPKSPVLVFGGGLSLSYKPIRWAGIHFIGGYRVVKDNATKLNFNGPFYAFGLQLYLHEIIQDSRYAIKKHNYKKDIKTLSAQ